MKIDLIDLFQMLLLLVFLLGVVCYTIHTIKSYLRENIYSIVRRIQVIRPEYSSYMTIKDYEAFEKYGIWRYVVYLPMKWCSQV